MGADQPDTQIPTTTPSTRPSLGRGGQQDAYCRETRRTARAALAVPSMGPPAIVQNQSARESRLDSSCLGDALIPNLERLMSNPEVTLPLSTTLDFNWKQIAQAICPPPDYDPLAINFERSNGVSRLFLAEDAEFCRPDLDTVVEPPSDPESDFEPLIGQPPRGKIPYYVGPLSKSELDRLFPSGTLSQLLGEITGSTTLYAHWGEGGSGTGYHCEDGNERSYNVNCSGYKFWVLVDPRDTAKFEDLCERLVPGQKGRGLRCDQFVRHKCVVITLARLRAERIRFETVCAGPGDMVVTQPRQYHLVVNLTDSKRKKNREPRTDMTFLAAACRDRAAFFRLCSLIQAWRDRTLPLMEVDHEKNVAPQLVDILDHAEANTTLSRFVCRFANERLAHVTKMPDYQKTPTESITNLLSELHRDDTGKNRQKLQDQPKQGCD